MSKNEIPVRENNFIINGTQIRDRITEVVKMRIGDIAHNPNNWRIHGKFQRDSYEAFLSEIGFAGIPLAYHSTATGALTLIDAHMRKEIHPDAIVWVAITDLDDTEAKALLAFYHGIEGFAHVNDEALGSLLQDIETSSPTLDRMFAEMAENEGLFFDETTENVPTLDELEEMYSTREEDFWPVINLKVAFATKDKWDKIFEKLPGDSENEKLINLIGALK